MKYAVPEPSKSNSLHCNYKTNKRTPSFQRSRKGIIPQHRYENLKKQKLTSVKFKFPKISQQESKGSSIKCNFQQAFSSARSSSPLPQIHKFPDWSILPDLAAVPKQWRSRMFTYMRTKCRNRLLLQCIFPFIECRRRTSFGSSSSLPQCLEKYRAKNPLLVTSNWSHDLSYHTLPTCCI